MKTLPLHLHDLLNRVENHFDLEAPATPALLDDLSSFMQGQIRPHAVFRTNDCDVLCCSVTGRMEATFPAHKLSGYPTDMDALLAAAAWALRAGALTFEWLEPPPVQVSTTEIGSQPKTDVMFDKARGDLLPDAVVFGYTEPEGVDHSGYPDLAGPDADLSAELDRHSSLWQVIRCMQNAIKELSDSENCYADDEEGTHILHEEVDVIVNHLTHGNEWSAIQYSDAMGIEEDS